MAKNLTYEFVKERIEEDHPGCRVVSKEYKNNLGKIEIICEKRHHFLTTYNCIKGGRWCPKCFAERKKIPLTEVRKKIKEIHPGCEVVSETYLGNKEKIEIICEEGHQFLIRFSHIKQGHWCPKCNQKKRRLPYFLIKKTTEEAHPGCKVISESYTNCDCKINILCENGHNFWIEYSHIRQGKWCLDCSGRKKHNIEHINHVIEKSHPGARLLSENYINNHEKLSFICENGHKFLMKYSHTQQGSWCPMCAPERSRVTNKKRYGCEYVAQNKDVALKQARKLNNPSVRIHWKTGEECWCQGGWEPLVIDYFNENKIDFIWQPGVFSLSSGKTYRPDAYLPDQDLYIEIKGYFRGDALAKWTEFHNVIHSNSELWDQKKLKSLGIL